MNQASLKFHNHLSDLTLNWDAKSALLLNYLKIVCQPATKSFKFHRDKYKYGGHSEPSNLEVLYINETH